MRHRSLSRPFASGVASLFLVIGTPALAVEARSGAHRVPLVELFTSEGCSSCPAADRFVSALGSEAEGFEAVVPLAFHVSVWDYLGWQDRFAMSACDRRQEGYARAARSAPSALSASIYTPQLLVDGRVVREGLAKFELAVAAAGREEATVDVVLAAGWDASGKEVVARASATGREGRTAPGEPLVLRIAVFERRLETEVGAGENRGRKLEHDFVVRALPAPARCDTEKGRGSCEAQARVHVRAGWKARDLGVAAFVQGERTLAVYQAVAAMVLGRGEGGEQVDRRDRR